MNVELWRKVARYAVGAVGALLLTAIIWSLTLEGHVALVDVYVRAILEMTEGAAHLTFAEALDAMLLLLVTFVIAFSHAMNTAGTITMKLIGWALDKRQQTMSLPEEKGWTVPMYILSLFVAFVLSRTVNHYF